jgi:colicin import membrane protein
MKDFQPDSRPPEKHPRRFLSLILTVAVHVGLLVFLFVGVNWQSKPPGSLEVGLVSAPPAPVSAPPEPRPEPVPEPQKPEPVVQEPPKPEPPKPVVEQPKPEPQKPEIATKKPEKPKPEKPKPEQPKPAPLKQVNLQKQLDAAIARDAEARKANQLLNPGQGGRASQEELDAYRAAIAAKVRRNLIAPPGLSGNPEALFEIEQAPGGVVTDIQLVRSSGNQALDEAIKRAIRKSDPLPPPANPGLFDRKLKIAFRPLEE